MTREEINVEMTKAVKALNDGNVSAYVFQYADLPVICVQIDWGDWKHEHLKADWLMEQIGWTKFKIDVTADDGSDTYSAIRYYVRSV